MNSEERGRYLELASHEEWGSYGLTGRERLKVIPFLELGTEHIRNILRTQDQVQGDDRRMLEAILEDRMIRDALDPVDLVLDVMEDSW